MSKSESPVTSLEVQEQDKTPNGGLLGPVLKWATGIPNTLEYLAIAARNNAGQFVAQFGDIGFNFYVQNGANELLPGDFNPEMISTEEGRQEAKDLLIAIMRRHGAQRYAIFCEVKAQGGGADILVAAFEPGRSLSWVFDVDSMRGKEPPVPKTTSHHVGGFWADLLEAVAA